MTRAKTMTDAQVRAMRQTWAEWCAAGDARGYEALSKMYCCGASTARDIVQFRTRVKAGGDAAKKPPSQTKEAVQMRARRAAESFEVSRTSVQVQPNGLRIVTHRMGW